MPRMMSAFVVAVGMLLVALMFVSGLSIWAQGPSALGTYRLVEIWSQDVVRAPSGHLVDPSSLTVAADGTVYIVDAARQRIEVYRQGTFLQTIGGPGTAPGQLREPRGIAMLGDRLLVADTGNRRLQVLSADGRPLAQWPVPGEPWGVAVDGAGAIVVTDHAGDRLLVFDRTGQLRSTMGGSGSKPGELRGPTAVSVLDDGRWAVLDSGNRRVQLWRPDGVVAGLITSTGLLPQVDIAAAGPDRLLVAELRTLYVYDTVGLRAIASSRAPVPGGFAAVAVEPTSALTKTIWVALRSDQLSGLRRYAGLDLRTMSDDLRLPAPAGELRGPQRIVATSDSAYVLDALPRVQRLALDGRSADQFLVPPPVELAAADGTVFIASENVVRRFQGVSETWSWAWADVGWIGGLAFDERADRLWLLDVTGGQLVSLAHVLSGTVRLGANGFQAYTDLALTRDGRLVVVNRTGRQVEVYDVNGTRRTRLPVRGAPVRVDADRRGRLFVLTREGWIWRYGTAGELEAWWDAGAVPTASQARAGPTDLAVTEDDRVLVTDGVGHRILVFEEDPIHHGRAPSGSGCSHRPEKWALPSYLQLGQETTVTLRVVGQCVDEGRPVDIVLVLDRSGSMAGQKMAAAKAAAIAFVGEMNFAVSRVGVIAFSTDATMPIGLSSSVRDVLSALVGLQPPAGGTDIGEAIQLATDELLRNGRPAAERIIVLLSDGRPEGDVIDADQAATAAKASGIQLFAIGFGSDVDPALMQRIASSPDHYFFAPTIAELGHIYSEIARRITTAVTMQSAVITDVIPINMAYVDHSAEPPLSAKLGRELRWELANVGGELLIRYRLRPLEIGRWPTNVVARARYVDGHDMPGELEFPIPLVTVVGLPVPIYLPFAAVRSCQPGGTEVDVALVLDASSSMRGEKLHAAQSAAHTFVDALPTPRDRACLIAFHRQASLVVGLTTDRQQLHAAIDGLSTVTGTQIDGGLRLAREELMASGRPSAAKAVVLLTDGQNNAGPDPVLDAGDALREAGIALFSVAFGPDADVELLRRLAGPDRSFLALTGIELERIFQTLASQVSCP